MSFFGKACATYLRECPQWHLIPLHDVSAGHCSCSRGPTCPNAGKHPRISDWVKNASNDPVVIAEWDRLYPNANIGVVTGSKSSILLLDVDPGNGGLESLAKLEAQYGALPLTPKQKTGSGGFHFLFQMSDFSIGNSVCKLGPGLDIRGDGGQFVVAPSVSAKGKYHWVPGQAPWEVTKAQTPADLLSRLKPKLERAAPESPRIAFPPASPQVLDEARDALDAHGIAIQGQGGDEHTYKAAAIVCNDYALNEHEALLVMRPWNEECQPPWSESDLLAKIRGASKYASGEYGSRRKAEFLTIAKAIVADWRNSGSLEAGITPMVQQIRSLITSMRVDPVERDRIESHLIAETGVKSKALALSRAVVRDTAPRKATTASQDGLDVSQNGEPLCNVSNVVTLLTNLESELYFDDFFQRTIDEDGNEWKEANDYSLVLEIQKVIPKMPLSTVVQGVNAYAYSRHRNSVRDYYKGLKWDGVPRIEMFFIRALGTPDNEYTRAASRNFLRSMMARVRTPGCKVDTMPVLEGLQGAFKSTALRELVGDRLFAEVTEPLGSSEFGKCLEGKLLLEMGEMSSMNRAEVDLAKQTVSRSTDRYRKSFGLRAEDFPRQCVFAATTNKPDWNRDDTGARRFWPVPCTTADLEYIKANRELIFAEAYADVEAGKSWWEMPRELTEEIQESRRQAHPWEEAIAEFVADKSETRTSDILKHLEVPLERQNKTHEMLVGSILRLLKWQRVRVMFDGQRHWRWRCA